MAIDIFAQNATTLSSGAALQLGADVTTPGIYTVSINLKNMASGDTLVVTILGQSVASGPYSLMGGDTFTGAQATPLATFNGIVWPFNGQVFIQQTGGTLREYDWTITRLDA
jgi:hypothetical protein